LQDVNVVNAGFVLFFLAFLIFPRLARTCWLSLVLYTESVIVLQFIWSLSRTTLENDRLWGLVAADNLWFQSRYHLVILAFSVVQLDTYRFLQQQEKEIAFSEALQLQLQSTGVNDTSRDSFLMRISATVVNAFKSFFHRYTLTICYILMSIVGLTGEVNLIKLGYVYKHHNYQQVA
jgi:hypothetical protein